MNSKQSSHAAAALLALCSFCFPMASIAIEPYDNVPAKPGFFFVDYPTYFGADQFRDASGNKSNIYLRSYLNVFRFVYYGNAREHTYLATILLPVGRVEVSGDHDQGLGDTTIGSAFWLIDDQREKKWIGAAMFIDIPVGSYDPSRAANLGENVWKIRPTVFFAKELKKIHLEASVKFNIYEKNPDTGMKNGSELIVETYGGYMISPSILLGLHLNTAHASDNSFNGAPISDSGIKKNQVGISINLMASNDSGVTIEVLNDTYARNAPKGNTYLVRLFWKL
ncbi:MAG: SphA family protein [Sulfuricaulis sp.]